jgi:hypothetical protein
MGTATGALGSIGGRRSRERATPDQGAVPPPGVPGQQRDAYAITERSRISMGAPRLGATATPG